MHVGLINTPIYIYYNVNGGTITPATGSYTWATDGAGFISLNGTQQFRYVSYGETTGTDGVNNAQGTMVAGEAITIVFTWNASTDTYTITAKGTTTNISFSGTYNMSGKSSNALKIVTIDYRTTSSPFNPITVSYLKFE